MLPFHLSQFKFFSRSYCLKERRDTGTGNFCRVPIFFLFMSAIIFVVSDLEKLLPNRLDSPVCQKACYKYRYLFDFDVQATKMLSLYNAAGKLVREGSPGTAILQYNLSLEVDPENAQFSLMVVKDRWVACISLQTSVVDPNTLCLGPDPGIGSSLDPDPGPNLVSDLDPSLFT